MRRRNKIKFRVPNLSNSDNEDSNVPKPAPITKPILSTLYDDVEDDSTEPGVDNSHDLEKLELKLKERKKQKQKLPLVKDVGATIDNDGDNDNPSPTVLHHSSYSDLFIPFSSVISSKKVSILNLEDMEEDIKDVEDSDPNYPKSSQIQEIKQKRTILRQKLNTEPTGFHEKSKLSVEYDERAYIKLLDQEDKEILGMVLEKNGIGEERDNILWVEDQDLIEDGGLAISSEQRELQHLKRKARIEDALQQQELRDVEWESTQINKLQNSNDVHIYAQLPRRNPLYADDISLGDYVGMLLSNINTQSRTDALQRQLNELQANISKLTLRQEELVKQLESVV